MGGQGPAMRPTDWEDRAAGPRPLPIGCQTRYTPRALDWKVAVTGTIDENTRRRASSVHKVCAGHPSLRAATVRAGDSTSFMERSFPHGRCRSAGREGARAHAMGKCWVGSTKSVQGGFDFEKQPCIGAGTARKGLGDYRRGQKQGGEGDQRANEAEDVAVDKVCAGRSCEQAASVPAWKHDLKAVKVIRMLIEPVPG